MRHVLDASAVLAMLLNERGAERVTAMLETACVGSVNLAEVVTVLARRGIDSDRNNAIIDLLSVPVLVPDERLSRDAGLLWPETRSAGSSLGDRFALALARRLGATLVSSDRRLIEVAITLQIAVATIR